MNKESKKKLPVLSLAELKAYDGQGGRKAYIAYKGKVYDVTESLWWMEGTHQDSHVAGHDLTKEIDDAPHGEYVLERVEIVAELKKD